MRPEDTIINQACRNIIQTPVLFVLMLFGLYASAVSQVPTKLDSVMAFHLHAVGTLDSIADIQSISYELEVEQDGNKGKAELHYAFPDRAYEHIDMGYASWAVGNDGDTLWIRKNSGPATTGDSEDSASIFNDLYIEGYLYILDDQTYGYYELRRDTVIDGKGHYQLAMFPLNGDSLHAYIDQESGLMDCYRSFTGGHQTLVYQSDFRKMRGVAIPFHQRTELVGKEISIATDITDIKVNEPIPDSLFAMPDLGTQGPKFRFCCESDSAIVKFKLKKESIIIPARINGKKRCHFLLDSGASGCLITHKMAKKLGLGTMGQVTQSAIAGDVVYKFADIDSVEMGELIWYPGRVEVLYGNEETGDIFRSIDGILGYHFFMDFPMRVDFDDERIVVFDTTLANPVKTGTPVTIDLSHRVARKDMSLDGRPIRMLIDLGADFEIFLFSNYRWFYKLADDLRFDPADAQALTVGGHRPIKAGHADSLKFDGVYIDHPEVYIAPRPEGFHEVTGKEGLLGMGILSRYNLFIDYPDSKIYFDERQKKK